MFDIFIDKLKSLGKSRIMPVTIVYVLLVCMLIYRLFVLQIVKGQEYETSFSETTSKTRDIQATRGNIYDVKGRLLAYNVLSYNVTFMDTGEYTDSQILNAKVAQIIKILEKSGDKLDVDFKLQMDKKGNVTFNGSEKEILRFKRDIYDRKSVDELTEEEKNATAENVFEYLMSSTGVHSPKFKIDTDIKNPYQKYSKQEVYKIMCVRYAMFMNNYTKYQPLVIASNVSDKTVAAVKEYSGDISGLDVHSTTTREYTEKYAYSMSQVLGYTGKISEDAYNEMKSNKKDAGYSKEDQVGKTGVEKQFDDVLHGKNGTEKVLLNQNMRIVEVKEGVAAVAGKDVYLSIDAELQNAAYTLTEKQVAAIVIEKLSAGDQREFESNGSPDFHIPIKSVYYALLDNAVIDISHFTADDATSVEKNVYDKFLSERKQVFKNLKSLLNEKSPNERKKEYTEYIYKMLVRNEILLSSNYKDLNDDIYKKYVDEKISLGEFLRYALSQENWVDRTKFSEPDKFYDSDEIYDSLIKYIKEHLSDDDEFSRLIYKSMVYDSTSNKISANQICLLLFDQNVLKYNKDDYTSLKNGTKTAYSFLRSKIEKLEITPGQLGLDPCSGSVVITDPNDGKVKAMVSYPGYDNNKLANKIDSTYYSKLTTNDAYPLLNRAIQQKTAPGSTFKMITAIAGLEEHVIGRYEKINDPGQFNKIDPAPRCWKKGGHGYIDVVQAIEHSCNVFFYSIGYEFGRTTGHWDNVKSLKTLNKYASDFGLGSPSGVELPNEADNQLSTTQGVHSAIGQGTNNFNPINLAKYITGLSNQGKVYDLSIIKDSKAKVSKKLNYSASTWDAIKKGTWQVVNSSNSSYRSFYTDLPQSVSGKTGTAQENKKRPDHALFVSFAPSDNPEITVTTVIPNGYASSNAARLASKIYKYYFGDDKKKETILKEPVSIKDSSKVSAER